MRIQACTPRYWKTLCLLLIIYSKTKLVFVKRESRVKYFVGLNFQEVFFVVEESITTKLITLELYRIFPERKGLAHHAGTFRHRIVIYFDRERLYKVSKTGSELGRHKFALFKKEHLFVYFFY